MFLRRRLLGITQKSAWYLAHRIRAALESTPNTFTGPIEADETFIGGKESNKHPSRKLNQGRGPVGKTSIAGIKGRATGAVSATVVPNTNRQTLHAFVNSHTTQATIIYTDEYPDYRGLPNHRTVRHSTGQYVRGQAHTNGLESFWSLLKRA